MTGSAAHVFPPLESAAVIDDAQNEGSPRVANPHLDTFRLSMEQCVRQRLARDALDFICNHGMQAARAAFARHAHVAIGCNRKLGDQLVERLGEALTKLAWSAPRLNPVATFVDHSIGSVQGLFLIAAAAAVARMKDPVSLIMAASSDCSYTTMNRSVGSRKTVIVGALNRARQP